jgi:hypothetical protein
MATVFTDDTILTAARAYIAGGMDWRLAYKTALREYEVSLDRTEVFPTATNPIEEQGLELQRNGMRFYWAWKNAVQHHCPNDGD